MKPNAATQQPVRPLRLLWQIARVALVVGIMAFILRDVDGHQLLRNIAGIRPVYVAGAVVVWLAALSLAALRWKVLLHVTPAPPPLTATYIYTFIGAFYSQFLPGTITGDVVKGYYLARVGANKAVMWSSAVIDRLLGLVTNSALGFVALGFSPLFLELFGMSRLVAWGIAGLALAGAVTAFAVVGWLERFAARFPAPVERLYRVLLDYAQHPRLVALAALVSIGYFLMWALAIWLLMYAARITSLGYPAAVLLLAAVNIVTVLPISLNGWGLREGLLVFLLGQFGIPEEQAIVFSVLIPLLGALMGAVGGLFVATDYRHIQAEAS